MKTENRKRKIKILFLIFQFSIFCFQLLHAQVTFENPQINNDNKILFTVNHELSGTVSYRTLFMADATKTEATRILTCFPERMELLSNGAVLQIRNRYGTARYSVVDSTLGWIKREDSIPADAKALLPQAVSPDGKWACYVKKTDVATGKLYLKNMSTLEEFLLVDKCDFDFDEVPAKWAQDGSVFIYEKNGSLFFADPKAVYQKVQMEEEFRRIGEGSINCVAWANAKYLIYINRDLIYKISAKELYTRGLYSPMVGIGIVVGRLPLGFDSHKDKFWVNSLVDRIVTVKANSVVSSYRINGTGSSYISSVYSKPFSDIAGSAVDYNLFFCSDGTQVLWVNLVGIEDGKRKSSIYRLSSELKPLIKIDDTGTPLLSPDGRKLAFASGNMIRIYDLTNWREIGRLTGERIHSYVWSGNTKLYVGGEATVRSWTQDKRGYFTEKGKMLFLSSARTAFWKPNATNIVCAQSAYNKATFYDYDQFKNVWQASADDSRTSFEFMKKAEVSVYAVQNAKYRVYVGTTDNKLYENALYVRNFSGNGTTEAIYPETVVPTEERKRVSLIFDAIDSADGLTQILSVLAQYKVKATFFLNGEFIRRYPNECKQIYSAGHDCASMYFSTADLTSGGFIIDEEFIRRGLARNEDEFYAATGKELSLLWHAPFYKATDEIKAAGDLSGYRYIEAGRLSLDSYTLEQAANGKKWYLGAKDLVKIYVDSAEDEMVIPVTVGVSSGTRTDFLYEKLGLLIGNLLDDGFDFVLVRDLK